MPHRGQLFSSSLIQKKRPSAGASFHAPLHRFSEAGPGNVSQPFDASESNSYRSRGQLAAKRPSSNPRQKFDTLLIRQLNILYLS